ncbi:hypothetical protein [Candidatus Blastococcus massiliensis]|uniref:hypothetical protein n=1 Tax=Candidatus Blastococcus massiliensis TaxID=1470358 RepID=UPI0004AD9368|nr:hypothetical protein [Candidatus Blastococcus massiliensis]
MSSTDPQSPGGPHTPAQPTTQEIPVVTPAPAQPLPPHPGATPPAPVQTVHSTGPVGFVPGPPGPPSPPPPATGATSVWPESLGTGPVEGSTSPDPGRPAPRDRRALLGVALVAAALVLLQLGLTLRFGGESFWSEIPLWSAFATVCTALGLAGFASLVPGGRRLGGDTGWRVAAAGLVGLAVFWVLVVLPVVAGDRGFLLTAALGCLGAALWTGPARKS